MTGDESNNICVYVAMRILAHLEYEGEAYCINDVNRKVIEIANEALDGTGITIMDIMKRINDDPEDIKLCRIEELLV